MKVLLVTGVIEKGKEFPSTKDRIYHLKESLAEVNIYDKEVKVVLEMPCASKGHIEIRAYENSVIFSDHPQRRYQVITIPQYSEVPQETKICF